MHYSHNIAEREARRLQHSCSVIPGLFRLHAKILRKMSVPIKTGVPEVNKTLAPGLRTKASL